MAKPDAGTYEPNKRVMLKVKHERDCDCVVAGFRWHKKRRRRPRSARCCSACTTTPAACSTSACARASPTAKRRELVEFLAPYREDALADHPWQRVGRARCRGGDGRQRMPGGQSRWSQGKDLSWEPLRPELVVEVAYDHMQGIRFRHTAQFRRWRTDKQPARLHLRAARGRAAAGARRRSSRREHAEGLERHSFVRERCAGSGACFASCASRHSRVGIVVGIGRLLRRAQRPPGRGAG